MGRILYMARKEIIQVFRDQRMVSILFIAPIMQLFLFGYAVNLDVTNVKLAVMDQDNSAESRDLVAAILQSGYFISAGRALSDKEISDDLLYGKADVVMVVPYRFAADVAAGRKTQVQLLLDGGQSNTATVAMGYLGKIFAAHAMSTIEVRLAAISALFGGSPVTLPMINTQTRVRFNPELKSTWFMVPAVLGMIMMITTMLLTSLAITREREVGTMEQLVVTPIKSWQLLAGKMLPFAVIGIVDVTLILIVARGHFGLPMAGSLGLLYFATADFLFATLGLGLMISTMAHTQQQAMFVTLFIMLPSTLLSGFFFPIDNMPVAVQYLTYVNPLRFYLMIVRAIILKGNGWAVLAPQFGLLFLLGAILFGVASMRFSKTVQ
jgi:ABC-2 type transport system permease protein